MVFLPKRKYYQVSLPTIAVSICVPMVTVRINCATTPEQQIQLLVEIRDIGQMDRLSMIVKSFGVL